MIRRPPTSTRTDRSFPHRRSSDLIARRVNAWNRRFEVVIDDDSTITGKHYAALLQPKPVAIGSASGGRSEEHTSELQSLMRISYAVFCLKKQRINTYKLYKCIQIQTTTSTDTPDLIYPGEK